MELNPIHGLDGQGAAEVTTALRAGGRFVFYETCVSCVVATRRWPSPLHYLRPGEKGIVRGLRYSLVSFLLGWWGVPWGLVYTPLVLLTNLSGGCDVTEAVRRQAQQA